jgi:hypothetical protein
VSFLSGAEQKKAQEALSTVALKCLAVVLRRAIGSTIHFTQNSGPVFSSLIAISANWQAEMYSAFLLGGVRFGMVAEIQNP